MHILYITSIQLIFVYERLWMDKSYTMRRVLENISNLGYKHSFDINFRFV